MHKPAAKQNDLIEATDTHLVQMPSGGTPAPLPHPFAGPLTQNLSRSVFINGQAAATIGSEALNTPPHTPTPPGLSFVTQPTNRATVMTGSDTVFINGLAAARGGDVVQTCSDPVPNLSGTIRTVGDNVFTG